MPFIVYKMEIKQNDDMITIFDNLRLKNPTQDDTEETLIKYINTELVGTDDIKDFIRGKDLKKSYNIWLMKNNYNPCKITNSSFITRLRIYLNPYYKERLRYYIDGKQIERSRSVFTNIKYKTI